MYIPRILHPHVHVIGRSAGVVVDRFLGVSKLNFTKTPSTQSSRAVGTFVRSVMRVFVVYNRIVAKHKTINVLVYRKIFSK